MNKQPLLLLVAGLLCAGGAAFVAPRYLKDEATDGGPSTLLLVATRDIDYGEKLTTGKGEEANVSFVAWPAGYVPDGAVVRPGEGEFKEELRADRSLVRHQVVQRSLTVAEADFLPRDKVYRAPITVDPRDMIYARPGEYVDVFRGSGVKLRKVIGCALVVPPPDEKADGDEGEKRGKDKDARPVVYLLVERSRSTLFLRATDSKDLRIQPAQGDTSGATVFVDDTPTVAEYHAADDIKEAHAYVKAERFADALAVLRGIDEGQLGDQRPQWVAAVETCERGLAKRLYADAGSAFEDGEMQRTVDLCARVAEEYPHATDVVEQARELREQAVAEIANRKMQERYVLAVTGLEEVIRGGDIPGARQKLADFQEAFGTYAPPAGMDGPEEVTAACEARLAADQEIFDRRKNFFEALVKAGKPDRAQEKFRELHERFPRHPYVLETAAELEDLETNQQ